MEYKQIDAGLLNNTLAGITYVSDTGGDDHKPFGITGPDYDGNVIATIARNSYFESGWFVAIIRGDDYEHPTTYGFGLTDSVTVTGSTLSQWALGLHVKYNGGTSDDYRVRVFNVSTYLHTVNDSTTMYVYLNDIPFMTITRGKSGTYFMVSHAEQFHKTIHKLTPAMVNTWTQYCTEQLRYKAAPPLPEPMLTGFSKVAMVLDQLLPTT